jgi:hypothetical protein
LDLFLFGFDKVFIVLLTLIQGFLQCFLLLFFALFNSAVELCCGILFDAFSLRGLI